MLMLRPAGKLKTGEARRVPIVRERFRKFGTITNEEVLSIKKDILITGPNACGKTRWLRKLQERGGEVWRMDRFMIRAVDPLIVWVENDLIRAHVELHCGDWAKVKSHQKVEDMIEWMHTQRIVLLIDDAHKLTGRKLDIAIRLAREATVLCVSATSEQAIPITLRMLIDSRAPQRILLKSDAAYDMTGLVLWLFILAAISVGWWQLAAVVGGAKVLAGGRRAAKQA